MTLWQPDCSASVRLRLPGTARGLPSRRSNRAIARQTKREAQSERYGEKLRETEAESERGSQRDRLKHARTRARTHTQTCPVSAAGRGTGAPEVTQCLSAVPEGSEIVGVPAPHNCMCNQQCMQSMRVQHGHKASVQHMYVKHVCTKRTQRYDAAYICRHATASCMHRNDATYV